MPEQQPFQQSYLLRLWREDAQSPWRASLQNVATNERIGFADLQSLFLFVQTQTEASSKSQKDSQNE
ncbi:MAG: hypothetical protein CL608_05505 [Anaerolineaceae bacterium]|nr:hypothetical protein [Anaerolineaceae bacterium]